MKRHPTDLIALLFGLAFSAVGGTFVAHELADRSFDPAWVAAIGLVTLGVVALIATVVRPRPAAEPDVAGEPDVATEGDGSKPAPETRSADETEPAPQEYS